jgi:hypothetical protein
MKVQSEISAYHVKTTLNITVMLSLIVPHTSLTVNAIMSDLRIS